MSILTILGPIIGKLLVVAYERVTKHLQSTKIGVAMGATAVGFMETFGCDATLMNEAIITSLVMAPSLLGTDPNKVGDTLLEAVRKAVAEKKHSNAVVAAAEAEQKKWDIKAPVVLLALLLAGCTTAADLGGGRYAVPRVAETRSPFGTNVTYSKLDVCDRVENEASLLKPSQDAYSYTGCVSMTDWELRSSKGQGGEVVSGLMNALSFGLLGWLASGNGGSDVTNNVSQSQAQAQGQSQSLKNGNGGGKK